ncbi:sporulation protein, partial [candidate division GN15 bacterium]|nr:sporulation protein [candidate division GN15 bacterium]
VGAGFGGGGGGGAKIEPAAFIIMDENGISLLPAKKGQWENVIESIPGIAKKITKWAEGFKSDDDGEEDKADNGNGDEPKPGE